MNAKILIIDDSGLTRRPRARSVAARRRPSAAPVGRRDLSRERVGSGRSGVVPVDDEIGEQRDVLALVVDPAGDEQDGAVPPHRSGLLEEAREDDDLDAALQVLDRGDRHLGAGFGHDRAQPVDDPADHDALAVE